MSLLVGLQGRLVPEGLVALIAPETVLHVLELLRIHLLLIVADIPQVEPKRLLALELDAAVRAVERTFQHALVFRAFLTQLLRQQEARVLAGGVGRLLLHTRFTRQPAGRLLSLIVSSLVPFHFDSTRAFMLLQGPQALIKLIAGWTRNGQLLRVLHHVPLQKLGTTRHFATHLAGPLIQIIASGRPSGPN